MTSREQLWTLALGLGGLLVGGFTLLPVFAPSPQVPTVTRIALPDTQTVAQTEPAEPPTYPTTTSIKPLISGRVNLNTASQEQLEALPKVGPSLALRIIGGRPYRSLADLDKVKGVGEGTLKALTPLVSY